MSNAPRIAPRDACVSLAALVLIAAWEASGWDLDLLGLYGNAGGFAWREHWLTRTVLHDAGRWFALACLLVITLDAWRPLVEGPSRRQRRYWLAVLLANLLFAPLLKRFSLTSCPWDLIPFGGQIPYVPYWMPGITDGGPGHCFPAGHPVAGFAFFATYFLWRPHRPVIARCLLAAVLIVGSAFAWTQLMRGAHFLGHGAWSAWLCWTLPVLAQRFAPADRHASRATPSRPSSRVGTTRPASSASAASTTSSTDTSTPLSPRLR